MDKIEGFGNGILEIVNNDQQWKFPNALIGCSITPH